MDNKLKYEISSIIPDIGNLLNEKSKQEFINTSTENLHLFHFGLGTWIRNFILKDDSVIFRLFIENGIHEKDEMSITIINELYKYLNEN